MEEVRIVRGYNRSVLYDLNRQDFQFVPTEFSALVKKIEGVNLPELSESEQIWYDKMVQEEYFFLINKSIFPHFKTLSLDWEHPSYIMNAIVHDSNYLGKSIQLVESLICKYLLVIVEDVERIEKIMIQYFSESNFHKVDFLVNKTFDSETLTELYFKFPVLGIVKQGIVNEIRETKIVNINSRYFMETQKFNAYFNRKIYFDIDGNLKNAPECTEAFGNIKEIENKEALKEIISTASFQKYWNVGHDSISNCSECELRYMCFDSRVPKQRKNGEWYHETECEYNPYISKWKDDNGFHSLSECGIIDNADEFSINHNQVSKINAEIWKE